MANATCSLTVRWARRIGVVLTLALLLGGGMTLATGPTFAHFQTAPVASPTGPYDLALAGHVGGDVRAVAVQGDYVYLGIGPELAVVNVFDPAHPVRIGYVLLPDMVQDVQVAGHYAYIAAGYAGLQIVDIADPAHPIKAGALDTPGHAWSVAVSSGYAYIADRWEGLRVVNVSNPANPTEVGFLKTPDEARDVAVAGDYAYVADHMMGTRVINIADPAHPVEVGSIVTAGFNLGIAVAGHHAYVAAFDQGLRVLDVSDPAHPAEVGVYQTPTWAVRVALSGTLAYVADQYAGLQIVNVSNPVQPDLVGSYDTPGLAWGVAVAGNRVYIADGNQGPAYGNVTVVGGGLLLVNVSDPAHPAGLGAYNPPIPVGIAVAGSYVYTTTGLFQVPANHVYLADTRGDQRLMDISDPTQPVEVTSTLQGDLKVTTAGHYAYVANEQGFKVVDITDPSAPNMVGFLFITAWDVALSGNYAYVAGNWLRVVDISNPFSPQWVATYESPHGAVMGVVVAGHYAYLAESYGYMSVLDISNPITPTEITSLRTPWSATSVRLWGHYAYVTDWTGLLVADISDPLYPRQVSFSGLLGQAEDVGVAGNYVYVANQEGGLYILRNFGTRISGRVADWHGVPFSGVTLSTSDNLSVTTDVSGTYAFTDLTWNTYALTPALPGYTFWPVTRTATLPDQADGQDFWILPGPVSGTLESGTAFTLTYTDTQNLPAHLFFPAGSVSQTTTVVVTPTLAWGGAGWAFAGHAFDVMAFQGGAPLFNLSFNTPVTVTIHYSSADIGVITDESQLTLQWWNGSNWADAATTCSLAPPYTRDMASHVIQLPVCQAGRYALRGPTYQMWLPIVIR